MGATAGHVARDMNTGGVKSCILMQFITDTNDSASR